MQQKKISLLGATFLVAGMNIGAGMLGLPIKTAAVGFAPSLLGLIFSWIGMTATGLLMAAFCLRYRDQGHLVSFIRRRWGKGASSLAVAIYFFLFYSLAVAYSDGLRRIGEKLLPSIPSFLFPIGAFLLIFLLIYRQSRWISWVNNGLMFGLIFFYCLLISGIVHISWPLLSFVHWPSLGNAFPIMVGAFAHQFVIPSLVTYLHYDKKNIALALIIGTFIPLCVYALWESVVLGIVSPQQLQAHPEDAVVPLMQALDRPFLATVSAYFSLMAILTSFLGLVVGFFSFLRDVLPLQKVTHFGKVVLAAFTLLPPLGFALTYPHIFLHAFARGGAFGMIVLFGLFPLLLFWHLSAKEKRELAYRVISHRPRIAFCLFLFFFYAFIEVFI